MACDSRVITELNRKGQNEDVKDRDGTNAVAGHVVKLPAAVSSQAVSLLSKLLTLGKKLEECRTLMYVDCFLLPLARN